MMVISPGTKPEGIQYYPGMHGNQEIIHEVNIEDEEIENLENNEIEEVIEPIDDTTECDESDENDQFESEETYDNTEYFMKDLTVHSRHIWTIVVLLILHQFNMKCSSRPILMKEDSEE